MKILMVLFRSLGDVCMGTTVIHAVRAKYPDAQIDFMTEKQNVDTLDGNPDLNNIIVGSSYFEALSTYRKGGYDQLLKLNMVNHIETAWHHLPHLQNQHLVEWYGVKAGVDVTNDKTIYIYPSANDETKAKDIFDSLNSSKVIAFHTSSGQHSYGDVKDARVESKDWPIMYFDIIAERLSNKGYKVVQIGAKTDKKLSYEGSVDLTGKLSFKQTAAFFKHCIGFFGLDSGPAYLASDWAHIPSLILMGATQSHLYTKTNNGPSVGPRCDNAYFIDAIKPNNPNCKPVSCYVHCLINDACINKITTDEVFNKLKEILKIENK
jgi:ADP-heptose:LPS heptosyltransferase